MSRPDIPVTISGDPRGFQSALARVRALSKTTATDVAASFGRVKSVAGGVAGVITGIVSASAVAAIRDAASAIASVGDEARRAGLDVKSFQELKYVAEQNRVGVDALTDGIKELNLRADEFIVTGGGSAAEAFQRLGYSAEDLKRKLQDPAELFTEIIGRLGELDRAAQIRIMDEIFGGTGGEQFVQLIEAGEAGIRDTIKAANDLGIVLDEKMIEQAEEIDRQFNAIATTVGTNLKAAIVSAVASLGQFIDSFNEFERQQTRTLEDRQEAIMGEKNDTYRQIQEATQERIALGETGAGGMIDQSIAELQAHMDKLNEEENRIIEILSERNSPKPAAEGPKWTPPVIDLTEKSNKAGGGRSRQTSEAEKEKKAIDDVIASLREELAIIGLTDIERERTIALREAGVEATSKEGREISVLIDEKYRQLAAEEALAEQYERSEEAAERMGQVLDDQLMRIVDGSFDAKEAIAALLMEIINVQTNGQGLFGSLFSSIFGGGGGGFSSNFVPTTTLGDFLGYGGARAGGGDVSPGRIYRVNEYEDEFFAPTSHGRIIAPSKVRGGSAEGGDAGLTVVELRLDDALIASIIEQAGNQTVRIVRSNEEARANYRQNGGDDF
ncbi:phage tail tape measure protein [Sinorhizobium meliloti]|uniref:phage tail tape measure protein n=1 Tax=Rhizobium meliloti TaxID=382 RepID=UPI0001E4D2AD|nr:phage tail tape measure protein [Sinorhizobium meliloti]AEG04236.1 tail tape measure protein TP901 core region [Sinorhizobium meliloti BL225C]MDE4545176.1 phage tail tape measure protein [Sinorhizobium meliloti]MDE4573801.1 phage tail tape measure protein [Sinorhizobium meliloti]SDY98207.1 Phage-related minor tail protein [Sinorhizobium meliloti]